MPFRTLPLPLLYSIKGAVVDLREVIALQQTSNGVTTGIKIFLRGGAVLDALMFGTDYGNMLTAFTTLHVA